MLFRVLACAKGHRRWLVIDQLGLLIDPPFVVCMADDFGNVRFTFENTCFSAIHHLVGGSRHDV